MYFLLVDWKNIQLMCFKCKLRTKMPFFFFPPKPYPPIHRGTTKIRAGMRMVPRARPEGFRSCSVRTSPSPRQREMRAAVSRSLGWHKRKREERIWTVRIRRGLGFWRRDWGRGNWSLVPSRVLVDFLREGSIHATQRRIAAVRGTIFVP